MAHPKATRDDLRKRYVFDRLSLAQSADLVGVSYGTATRWKDASAGQGDDWDKVRTAHTMAGGDLENLSRQLLTDYLLEANNTMEIIKSVDETGEGKLSAIQRVELLTSLSDSCSKMVSASKRLMPETSELATGLKVVGLLSDFIKAVAPQHLVAFVEILPEFAQKLEKELK